MTALLRALVNLGVGGFALMVVLYLLPMTSSSHQGNAGSLADQLKFLIREQQRSDALDRSMQVIMERTTGKENITQELLKGRITLGEAVVRFKALSELSDGYSSEYRPLFWGTSDEERICREVINRAQFSRGMNPPSEVDAVTACLEAQLQRYLESQSDKNH